MTTEVSPAVNTIIAQALQAAGIPPRNIELPPEGNKEPSGQIPNLDGSLKGATKGERLEGTEESEDSEVSKAEAEKASKPKSGEPAEQPLGKADIEAAISQASSKFQSIMDRKINQLQLQMQGTINALNQFFEAQEDSSLVGLPESERLEKRLERLEKGGKQPRIAVQQSIEEQPTQFYQYLVNFVDAVGLRIDDKRIDWAPDATDPQVGFSRFTTSVKKALVEDQTKIIQELKSDGDREIQKVRKKAGVDRVSTSGPSGAGLPDVSKMTPFEKIDLGFKMEAEASQTK